jgi:hypothetical protein
MGVTFGLALPRPSDRCRGSCRGRSPLKGGAVCAPSLATRPQGAPLTVILTGKRMPGTEDGPAPDFAAAVPSSALRREPPACGSGAAARRRRRARQGFRPRGRDMADAPRRTGPRHYPMRPSAWWSSRRASRALPRHFASSAVRPVRAEARTVACRRRALEAVEKVVTAR